MNCDCRNILDVYIKLWAWNVRQRTKYAIQFKFDSIPLCVAYTQRDYSFGNLEGTTYSGVKSFCLYWRWKCGQTAKNLNMIQNLLKLPLFISWYQTTLMAVIESYIESIKMYSYANSILLIHYCQNSLYSTLI